MSANITLTPDTGTAVTLYANEAAAVAAGSALVFVGVSSGRASPWEIIGYPGADAIRAKFMGAKPRTYAIAGFVCTTNETTMRTEMNKIMGLNKAKAYYTITSGNLMLHDGGGLIVEDVISMLVGGGSGPMWHFEVRMRDLGTT